MKCIICKKQQAFYGTESEAIHCKKCKTSNDINVTINNYATCDKHIKKDKNSCLIVSDDKYPPNLKDSIVPNNTMKKVNGVILNRDTDLEMWEETEQLLISHMVSSEVSGNLEDIMTNFLNEPDISETTISIEEIRDTQSDDFRSLMPNLNAEIESDTDSELSGKNQNNESNDIGELKDKESKNVTIKITSLTDKIELMNVIIEEQEKKLLDYDNLTFETSQLRQDKKALMKEIKVLIQTDTKRKNSIEELYIELKKKNKRIEGLINLVSKLDQFYNESSKELEIAHRIFEDREQNVAKLKSERNSALIRISFLNRQLEEEKQFIYLEWTISRHKNVCTLLGIRTSEETNFTKVLITSLKTKYFAKQRTYTATVDYLTTFQFEIIRSGPIHFVKQQGCTCFKPKDVVIQELFRTITG